MLDIELLPGFTLFELIWVLTVVIICFFAARIITIYLRRELKDNLKPSELRILLKGVNFFAMIIALIIIIPVLGINPMGILVAGGIIGLVLAFACQSIVTNFISGIFLAIERPIKIGDGVNIKDKGGTVEDVKIMSTIIRGYDGYIYRLPNETVFTNIITNYSSTPARRFEYTIGISYSDDAKKAIEIINDLIEEQPYILKNPTHQAFVEELGDNAITIIVRIWAPSEVWYSVKMEFLNEIKATLEENDIEIPFPQRTVWFANNPPKQT